jgi:polyphosphate kinase 2 (PPK2 family)
LPTIVAPVHKSKKDYKKMLEDHVVQLSVLQQLHYASNRYAVLLIFQAMDAAGKDGAILHVMSGVNPQGCQVFSFPSNRSMTFSGVPREISLSEEKSGSSTGPTTKRC